MKKRLVTSALPYVNNVPHLGNLLQVLSGDVFARFCRSKGYETLYICGTDEYGTATETKAMEEGITPEELCGRFYKLHKEIYSWFCIAFDKFGRTSTTRQKEIVQSIFLDLDKAGYIKEQTIEQLFCGKCSRFLADRYIKGKCPYCGFEDARGDQCENCGKLLEPTELIDPRCSTCGATPQPKSTSHLYIDLPEIKPKLESWIKEASSKGFWANNAVQMTQAWIRDGLRERAITRDLKWGIPVPKDGYRDKVFYVWFDAPIGYISITACLGDEENFDWKTWWMNRENVELFQFIGKDNIPFHTVIFPSSLLGTGKQWTMLHHMSSTEYLNYEDGKFSKSRGVGVFGNDAMESGIPADIWRFYLFYNRPEKSDYTFTWKDFQEKVNGELIGNLGNLINRTLSFVSRFFEGQIPEAQSNMDFWKEIKLVEQEITDGLERAELRDCLNKIFRISAISNKAFQDCAPWKALKENPEKAATLIKDLCYVIRDLAIMIYPFLPSSAEKIAGFFGKTIGKDDLNWSKLGTLTGLNEITTTEVLFKKLDDDIIDLLHKRHSGVEILSNPSNNPDPGNKKTDDKIDTKGTIVNEQEKANVPEINLYNDLPIEQRFQKLIRLKVAEIKNVERHPKADKLYVETLDDGSGNDRIIVSGLVPYCTPEDLLGKKVLIVDNLKAAKLRGIESRGMLLAAEMNDAEGKLIVEPLEVPWANIGDIVQVESNENIDISDEVNIDAFLTIPIHVESGNVMVGKKCLTISGRKITSSKVSNGGVH